MAAGAFAAAASAVPAPAAKSHSGTKRSASQESPPCGFSPNFSVPPPPLESTFPSGGSSKHGGSSGGLKGLLSGEATCFKVQVVGQGFRNFRGGKKEDQVGSLTSRASFTLRTEPAFGLPGGSFYISFWDHAGDNPTMELVGDSQVFDKLNFRPYYEIYQLWYQQKFWNGKFRVKGGKVDANTEFSLNKYGLAFLNSSAQLSAAEFTLPTLPAPMPSINIFFRPSAMFYTGFGFYHSNRTVGFLNFHGHPESSRSARNGNWLNGEAGLVWPRVGSAGGGYLKFGAWGHTGDFTRFDGSIQHGTRGFYALVGQKFGGGGSQRGVRTFFEYSRSDPAVAKTYRALGSGITWTGFLPGRPKDVLGFGPEYARFSPKRHLPHGYELALETFYRAHLASWAILEPDAQYIVHPSGKHPSALVATLRFQMQF